MLCLVFALEEPFVTSLATAGGLGHVAHALVVDEHAFLLPQGLHRLHAGVLHPVHLLHLVSILSTLGVSEL